MLQIQPLPEDGSGCFYVHDPELQGAAAFSAMFTELEDAKLFLRAKKKRAAQEAYLRSRRNGETDADRPILVERGIS